MNCKKQLKLSLKIQNPAKFERNVTLLPQDKNEHFCFGSAAMPSSFTDIYEIREKIGEGQQAQVYKIIERNSGKTLAGKIYYTSDQELIQMLKKEKEILESLCHTNIVKFEGFFEESNYYVLLTEFFDSIQLQNYILKSEFTQNRTSILNQIFDALSYLHSKNIIHQDLNVKNILIDPITHHVKIVDFGLSKHEYMESLAFSPQGNFKYRPPVFFGGFQNRFYIDVWSFGLLVLSVMMKTIFTTKKTLQLIENHQSLNLQKEIKLVLAFMAEELLDEKKEQRNEIGKSPLISFPYLW